jgi:hypothetical protein
MGFKMVFLFTVLINVMLFLTQSSVTHIAAETGETGIIINSNNEYITAFDYGGTQNPDITGELPAAASGIEPGTGSFFVDTFVAFKNWLTGTTGFKYFSLMVNAPINFLKNMHVPNELSYILGYLWHLWTIICVVFFLRGMD